MSHPHDARELGGSLIRSTKLGSRMMLSLVVGLVMGVVQEVLGFGAVVIQEGAKGKTGDFDAKENIVSMLQPFAVPKAQGGNFPFLDTFRKIRVAHSIHVRSG